MQGFTAMVKKSNAAVLLTYNLPISGGVRFTARFSSEPFRGSLLSKRFGFLKLPSVTRRENKTL